MQLYTNDEKNRPFSVLQHQAQFGLNPALVVVAEIQQRRSFAITTCTAYKVYVATERYS